MLDIREYINESIRLDEAKNVNVDDVIDGCKKITKWNTANNIKNLMASYMSAGDVEEFSKKHWDVCVDIVDQVAEIVSDFLKGAMGVISISQLTDTLVDELEDNGYDKSYDNSDPDCDWDVDEIINLFNTVSIKVCKESWLI